jgi:hypothetical protein
MKIIGFNFTKISGERLDTFKANSIANTNIEILNIEKSKLEVIKEIETLKLNFKFTLLYKEDPKKEEKNAEISLLGNLLLAVDKEESKETLKLWKKKEVPQILRSPVFNFILEKCALKSLSLQEDLSLPFFPQLKFN